MVFDLGFSGSASELTRLFPSSWPKGLGFRVPSPKPFSVEGLRLGFVVWSFDGLSVIQCFWAEGRGPGLWFRP